MPCTLGDKETNYYWALAGDVFGICFTKGTACYLLSREIRAFVKDTLVCFIHALLDHSVEMPPPPSVPESWLMGPPIPSVTDYMVCQTMRVTYSQTGTPFKVLTVNTCCLQASSGAEGSFVPAPGHFVLLLCEGPVGTSLTPSSNCLQVAKPKTPKSREAESCLVGFCLFFFFLSLVSFCPQTVNTTNLYWFNAVRKVKEHEGRQRKQHGWGSGQVGCGAFSPMSAGIKVTQHRGTGSLSNISS